MLPAWMTEGGGDKDNSSAVVVQPAPPSAGQFSDNVQQDRPGGNVAPPPIPAAPMRHLNERESDRGLTNDRHNDRKRSRSRSPPPKSTSGGGTWMSRKGLKKSNFDVGPPEGAPIPQMAGGNGGGNANMFPNAASINNAMMSATEMSNLSQTKHARR